MSEFISSDARMALRGLVRAILDGIPHAREILADALGDMGDPREGHYRVWYAHNSLRCSSCPRCAEGASVWYEDTGELAAACDCGWRGPASALLPPLATLARD